MQKREHVKDNRAKRSNVEVTSIIGVGGRLLSCVRRVLSYTWHRERHVELLVMYDQTFGTRTLLAHAQRRRKEKGKIKAQRKKEEKIKIREKKCDPTVQIGPLRIDVTVTAKWPLWVLRNVTPFTPSHFQQSSEQIFLILVFVFLKTVFLEFVSNAL